MAIRYENRDAAIAGVPTAEANRRQRRALRAASIIGSIIALFVLLSLIRPMPAENVPNDASAPEASAPQQ
jgi:hypothetical protein